MRPRGIPVIVRMQLFYFNLQGTQLNLQITGWLSESKVSGNANARAIIAP